MERVLVFGLFCPKNEKLHGTRNLEFGTKNRNESSQGVQ
jgi:hypothetical protein